MGHLGAAEIRDMQGLAQRVTAAVGPELLNGDATVGELAWVWANNTGVLDEHWRHRRWHVDGELAAWGWAWLPYRVPRGDGTFRESTRAGLLWQAHPDRPELVTDVLDWYDEVADGVDRTLSVQSADTRGLERVTAHGYVFDAEDGGDTGSWVQFNARDLVDVPEPVLPDGFRFTSAAEVSVAAAVEAHRAAWHPSGFTEAALERVQRTWPYRPDLHVLVEAPDGTLVATAIAWLDEASRNAEFEPVGTHRDHRRRGLGTALQLHGMHLAKAAGADRMLVASRGAPSEPAAREMYYGVGFRMLSRDLPHLKTAT